MRRISIFFIWVFALALCSVVATAQSQPFADKDLEYTLELPSATWKATSRGDGLRSQAEFVNGDRMDGYLRVRKEVVDAGTTPTNLADHHQDTKLRYLNGFVQGTSERFAGRLNGVTASYEFTSAGKPMLGRLYYLQADNRTIYTLHFTGLRDKLLRIRNQTDSIARSFQLK